MITKTTSKAHMHTKLISVENTNLTLHNEDGHHKALSNINFCLLNGEHVGILGPNGSGKSTFLRMLAGQAWIDQDGGKITWYYKNQAEKSPIMARRLCALVSPALQEQYTRYQWSLNGEDILLTAFTNNDIQVTDEQKHHLAYLMAKQIKCSNLLKLDVSALSQGQLRLLLLGQALLREPKVLLLDEYLDGLDVNMRKHIIGILEQIAQNTTLVISTHRPQGLIQSIKKQIFIETGQLYHKAPNHIEIKSTQKKPNTNNTIKPIIIVQIGYLTIVNIGEYMD